LDHQSGQIIGPRIFQHAALRPANRGAHGGDDDGFLHDALSCKFLDKMSDSLVPE
jgi:hypothetical protein